MNPRFIFAGLVLVAGLCLWWVSLPVPPSLASNALPQPAQAVLSDPVVSDPVVWEAHDTEEPRDRVAAALRSVAPSGTPIEVFVVDGDSSQPIAGAQIELWMETDAPALLAPWRPRIAWPTVSFATTDPEGRALLPRIELAEHLGIVRALWQDGSEGWLACSEVIEGDAESVRLELRAAHCERRPLQREARIARPAPQRVPALALSRQNSWSWRVWAAIEGDELLVVAPRELRFDALFALDEVHLIRVEGFGAHDDAKASQHAAELRRARSLRVEAVDEGGAPRADVAFWAVAANELGVRVAARSDEGGQALLGAFFGGEVTLKRGAGVSTLDLGTCDLEVGSAALRIEVPAPRSILLKPRGMQEDLTLERLRIAGAEILGEPDAIDGAWRVSFLPAKLDARLEAELKVLGCIQCAFDFPLPPADQLTPIEVELERESTLALELLAPDDHDLQMELQRRSAEQAAWDAVSRRSTHSRASNFAADPAAAPGAAAEQDEDAERMLFGGLRAGYYRITDRQSGATSDELYLRAGEERTLRCDWRRARWAPVSVTIPEGYRRDMLRLEATWQKDPAQRKSNQDGGRCAVRTTNLGFEVRVPGDRDVQVEAKHLRLIAHESRSRGVLRTGFESLELSLDAGADLSFRVLPSLQVGNLRLLARAAGAETWSKVRITGWRGGGYRAVGLQPGSYDLLFEAENALPLKMNERRLIAGEQDLGVLKFDTGSVLRTTLRDLSASAQQSQAYELILRETRSAEELGRTPRELRSGYGGLEDEDSFLVMGIGPGTWELQVRRRDLWGTEGEALRCDPETIDFQEREDRHLAVVIRETN